MRILFIRHGEPDYAKDDLTDTGVRQAELLAQRLKDEGIEEIWSSPLGRAQRTARISSEVLKLPVQTLECMREIKWGSADGNQIFADGHPWDISDEMAHQGMDLTSTDWQTNRFFINNLFPYVCAMLHMDFTGITIVRLDKKTGKCTLPCLELANDAKHLKVN